MKLASLKSQRRTCYFYSGLLVFAVYLLLASVSLAQNADTRIAFLSGRSGNSEIYLMNPDGKRVRRITKHPQDDGTPAWSPDGQKITFSSFRDEHRLQGRGPILGEVYVMNPDGTDLINLTQSPKRWEGSSSWSPDGTQIAFTSGERFKWGGGFRMNIWVMDADGKNLRNLTNHDAHDRRPDWSPDGQQIAFQSDRNRDWEFEFEREIKGNWEIYVMNADGANPINLTNHPADDGAPSWSPDGRQIAFASDRDGNWEIYVMNADGANPINLTNHPADDGAPSWSPDGRQIAFASDRDGNWEIYVMNADGANPINLTNHPTWDTGPAWESVRPLNVAANESLAILWGKVKRTR